MGASLYVIPSEMLSLTLPRKKQQGKFRFKLYICHPEKQEYGSNSRNTI